MKAANSITMPQPAFNFRLGGTSSPQSTAVAEGLDTVPAAAVTSNK